MGVEVIRIFSYDFEMCCNLKPLEPLPPGAGTIAPDVYRLPERVDRSALIGLADWRGVMSTDAHVKRRWQTYYNVRTMKGAN